MLIKQLFRLVLVTNSEPNVQSKKNLLHNAPNYVRPSSTFFGRRPKKVGD